MISDAVKALLSQPMKGDARDNPPAVSFSDHKGDSVVTRVFYSNYGNDSYECAGKWLSLAKEQCISLSGPMWMDIKLILSLGEETAFDNAVAVINAYDLLTKGESEE